MCLQHHDRSNTESRVRFFDLFFDQTDPDFNQTLQPLCIEIKFNTINSFEWNHSRQSDFYKPSVLILLATPERIITDWRRLPPRR